MNTIKLPYSEIEAEIEGTPMIMPDSVLEITENGRYDVKRYVYADVNVEGGGDLSIATLTFTNGAGYVTGAIASDQENWSVSGGSADTLKIILYKGQAVIKISGVASTSGNIEDLGRDGWLVTGDCSVTISGAED